MITLIDGNSLLFRAYYGVHSHLTRHDGIPTGAVYGFINMILPILSGAKTSDSFVCVFDASRKTFRQDIYPEYKMNRSDTPQDLITQSGMVRTAMSSFRIPVLCIPGVEADDVIATIATKFCTTNDATRIITSDKDLMQLVSNCVYLYDGMKQREIRREQVLEKFGVLPEQVIDVQSLMGDSTDNVPGVPGIGPKKASELINQFGNLDNLYQNISDVKNERIKNLLISNKDMAYISKKLVTLKTDVDLPGLEITPFIFDTESAIKYVNQELESPSLSDKIKKLFPPEKYAGMHPQKQFEYPGSECPIDIVSDIKQPELKIEYQTITTESELDKFLSNIKSVLAFDTETTGLNQITSKMVGISLAYDENHGCYIPLRHKQNSQSLFETPETPTIKQLDINTVYKKLWPYFTNNKIIKIGHNLKYDLHIFANEGWDINEITPIDDTMLLSYILHGTLHGHGLDELAQKYLKHTNISFASLFATDIKDQDRHFDNLDIHIATPYAAEDSIICFALYNIMRPELESNKKLCDLYEKCDRPLLPILTEMERNGVLVNQSGLSQLSDIFHKQLDTIQSEIWTLAGTEFNIASPKQLGVVLFDTLGLKANKKRSTDADSLNDLIDEHPIIEKILNWRSIAKLSGTYTDSLPKQIEHDGRIHTTYLQTSTNTGRLSSREPNLQNIPIKTELGEEIRKCFIAPTGKTLISVDYSQIQLRLLADVANVSLFKETFLSGLDIHEQTARKIFNIPDNKPVPKDLRRAAKTVNFSIIYGVSSFGLSSQLNTSRQQAQEIINSYMSELPEVKQYIDDIKKFATEHKYVLTPWGRRIELPEISNPRGRSYALRAAINAPIQGFEADLMRYALIQIYNKIVKPNSQNIKIIMQVHDEIIFECDENMATEFAKQIKHEMENITSLSIP
ncbi:MAG: DNA polymerase I, partial [Alphaproteobacteria bacterium]